MLRRNFFLLMISLSVVLLGILDDSYAQQPAQLEQVKEGIFLLIQSGDYTAAQAAVEQLKTDFVTTEDLDKTLLEIVGEYQKAEQYQSGITLARYITDAWPNSNQAVWAQMLITQAKLNQGDDSGAQAEITRLASDYASDPNLPRTLYLVGEQLRWSGKYVEAKDLYEQIVQSHPSNEYAGKARLAVAGADVLSLVQSRSFEQAQAAAEKLITDFPNDPDVAQSLADIAQQFSWARRYDQAKALYEKVVQQFPGSPAAAAAQRCISKTGQVMNNIFALIDAGNYKSAQDGLDQLITEFGDEQDVPAMVYHVASRFEGIGRYGEASYCYQQILWRYPDDPQSDMAKIDIRRMTILTLSELGREQESQAELDRMIADFNDHPHLPTALMFTGEGYSKKADDLERSGQEKEAAEMYGKSLGIFESVINQYKSSSEVANACMWAGDMCRRLGDYQKAAGYYQRIADEFGEYEGVWRALVMIARCSQAMAREGLISHADSYEKAKEAYERIVRDYPESPGVKIAEKWLSSHQF